MANAVRWDADLRPTLSRLKMTPRPQGSRGTCSVFAMTFCIEFALRQRRAIREPLSVEFLNWAKNSATGQTKDGDFFDRIAAGYERYGMAPDSECPYQPSYDPKRTPAEATLQRASALPRLKGRFIKPWSVTEVVTDTQLAEIKAQLKKGTPVAVGLRWPKGGKEKRTVVESLSVMDWIPATDVFDGHSVALVGYTDNPAFPGGGVFLFANWAGTNWGDQGFGAMSYAYFKDYLNDAYVF